MKKESLSIMTVKTLLAVIIFAGIGTIIIGGGYIIWEYSKISGRISVTTSKLEYKQGEMVELIIKNSFDKEQKIYFSDIEKFNHLKLENNWEPIKQVWCPCQSHCYEEKVSIIIKAESQSKYEWDQTESWCTNNPAWYNRQEISNQVESGKYRFKIEVDEVGTIYSNEFIVAKEDIDQRKVYKNEEYGFELKYPKDWYQRDNYQGTDIMLLNTDKEIVRGGLRPDDYWLLPYSKRNPKYTDNWVGIGINVYQKPVDFNWDSWMKDNFSAIEKYENLDYSNLNSDLRGIKVVKSIGGISNIFLEGKDMLYNLRFFGAYPYDVDNDGLNYFEQVLSTFKFIEKDETSDWQTYRNEEFGFEFKFQDETGNIEISSTTSRITLSDLVHFESSIYRDPVVYIFIRNYDNKQFNNLNEYLNEGRGWDNSQAHSKLISIKKVFNNNDLTFFEVITELSGDAQITTPFKRKLYYIEYKKAKHNEFIEIMGPNINDDRFIDIIDTFKFTQK